MKIYLDSDYKCHVRNDGTRQEIETGFFNGKCAEYIEGYRFVPSGETWTREDGEVFTGEMVSPWKDYEQLAAYQNIYDRMLEQQSDMQAALDAIYGGETDD